jgi:hypothetical protein
MTALQRVASTKIPHPSQTSWPELPLDAWRDTLETVHRWMQVVGKIKLELTPLLNHWWNVALHPSAHGFTTGMIPYGERWFEIELDILEDALLIKTSDGGARGFRLPPRSVAEFYASTMSALRAVGIEAQIWPVPVEIEHPIPLDRDDQHRAYDKRYVVRCWQIIAMSTEILQQFQSRFLGKASPVHFFWGTFDLAASRFSGHRAPEPLPTHVIEREAYSHEVYSVGWWPGDSRLPAATYYSYIAPEPAGYGKASIATPGAYYHEQLNGYYLPYDELRRAGDPEGLLLDFCQQTYAAAADLAGWNRAELERA